MRSAAGIAMITMLVFVLVISLLSGALLSMVASQTRLMEQNIRRTKAFYIAEAQTVSMMDQWRLGASSPPVGIPWAFDPSGNPVAYKTPTITQNQITSLPAWNLLNGTMELNATCDYSNLNW